MTDLLIDTGAVVALMDAEEDKHEVCAEFFKDYRGRIFSTEAVLTEALYFLGDIFERQKRCLQFFVDAVQIYPLSPKNLTHALALMEKYQNLPMDFADATLVVLSEELACDEIFTLDRRGFAAYRWGRNRAFKIYP